MSQLLKINDAAKYLSVHPQAVRKLIREGKLVARHLGPKSTRIAVTDLQDFVAGLSTSKIANES